MDHKFHTTTQTAQILGLSRQTILHLIESGGLTARVYRVSEQRPIIRISQEAIDEFVARWSDDGGARNPGR